MREPDRIVRLKTVLARTGLSRSTIYRKIAEGTFPAQIKTAFTNLRVGFPDTLNGKEVDVVQGRGPRGLLTTMYFDKKTGLLVRVVRFGNSTVGRYPTQSDFDDYRDVNGIKFPFKYQFSWLDGRDQFTINDYKVNVPIDAKVFGRPAAGTKN